LLALTSLAVVVALINDPLVLAARARMPSARIEDVEHALGRDPSYKVRVEAALILGRLHQDRSLPALMSALRDGHPVVRATAARALGLIGDPSARGSLERAEKDEAPLVRRMAREAQRAIDLREQRDLREGEAARRQRTRLAFDVKAMGDNTRKATPALRGYMRDVLNDRLRTIGEVGGQPQAASFVIDGVIKNLAMNTRADNVEVTCAVQLVVSRATGGVFLLTSGEATVQKPRHQWTPQQRPHMEMEAVENAVRGASEELVSNLARQQ
jgi:hypothetical protein